MGGWVGRGDRCVCVCVCGLGEQSINQATCSSAVYFNEISKPKPLKNKLLLYTELSYGP